MQNQNQNQKTTYLVIYKGMFGNNETRIFKYKTKTGAKNRITKYPQWFVEPNGPLFGLSEINEYSDMELSNMIITKQGICYKKNYVIPVKQNLINII